MLSHTQLQTGSKFWRAVAVTLVLTIFFQKKNPGTSHIPTMAPRTRLASKRQMNASGIAFKAKTTEKDVDLWFKRLNEELWTKKTPRAGWHQLLNHTTHIVVAKRKIVVVQKIADTMLAESPCAAVQDDMVAQPECVVEQPAPVALAVDEQLAAEEEMGEQPIPVAQPACVVEQPGPVAQDDVTEQLASAAEEDVPMPVPLTASPEQLERERILAQQVSVSYF